MGRKPAPASHYLLRLRDTPTLQRHIDRHVRRGSVDENSYVDKTIAYLRKRLKRDRLTLGDIFSSEAEIKLLRQQGHYIAAQVHLAILREGTARYERHIQQLHNELRLAKKSLTDLLTTVEEIRLLERKGMKLLARTFATGLYEDSPSYIVRLRRLRKKLTELNLEPEDIGLSRTLFDILPKDEMHIA